MEYSLVFHTVARFYNFTCCLDDTVFLTCKCVVLPFVRLITFSAQIPNGSSSIRKIRTFIKHKNVQNLKCCQNFTRFHNVTMYLQITNCNIF